VREFYRKLDNGKIKINWNKKPIRMDLFLSFLTVKVERQVKFLGSDTGWTQFKGEDRLEIGGGIVNGVEYLDRIQYKKNLDNAYNNYINPFYMFEILNDEGKKFFLEYYGEDIAAILKKAQAKLDAAQQQRDAIYEFWGKHGVV
jgi:hypothetical protein